MVKKSNSNTFDLIYYDILDEFAGLFSLLAQLLHGSFTANQKNKTISEDSVASLRIFT